MKLIAVYSLALLIFGIHFASHALDQSKCSTFLNKGWYKKYEYGGVDQPLTKATKKHGVSKATAVTSTEGSTATLDPGYWSNVTTSETQFISSFGACSAIALQELKRQRNLYIVQNNNRIFHEIAAGGGEHLRVIATLSLCESSFFELLGEKMQSNMQQFLEVENDIYGDLVNQIIRSDQRLAEGCHVFN